MQAETHHALDAIKTAIELLRTHIGVEAGKGAADRAGGGKSIPQISGMIRKMPNLSCVEKNQLETQLGQLAELEDGMADQLEMIHLAEEEGDSDLVAEAEQALQQMAVLAGKRQIATLLSGEADSNNCFLEIHPGAGGTEAQDWAAMLFRMYSRWAEARGFKTELIEETAGEEAGIKSVTLTGYRRYCLWLDEN